MHCQKNESHNTENEEFEIRIRLLIPRLIDIVFVLFIWSIFHILRCPFPQWSFPTHAVSKSFQCSVSHSVNPLLSFSLPLSPFTPHSVFTCCHLIWILWQFCRRYHWINLIEWTRCFTYGLDTIQAHQVKVEITTNKDLWDCSEEFAKWICRFSSFSLSNFLLNIFSPSFCGQKT